MVLVGNVAEVGVRDVPTGKELLPQMRLFFWGGGGRLRTGRALRDITMTYMTRGRGSDASDEGFSLFKNLSQGSTTLRSQGSRTYSAGSASDIGVVGIYRLGLRMRNLGCAPSTPSARNRVRP